MVDSIIEGKKGGLTMGGNPPDKAKKREGLSVKMEKAFTSKK
jgi:hypothetical protein